MRRLFHTDGTITALPGDPLWGEHDIRWRFTKSQLGVKGQYVQVSHHITLHRAGFAYAAGVNKAALMGVRTAVFVVCPSAAGSTARNDYRLASARTFPHPTLFFSRIRRCRSTAGPA